MAQPKLGTDRPRSLRVALLSRCDGLLNALIDGRRPPGRNSSTHHSFAVHALLGRFDCTRGLVSTSLGCIDDPTELCRIRRCTARFFTPRVASRVCNNATRVFSSNLALHAPTMPPRLLLLPWTVTDRLSFLSFFDPSFPSLSRWLRLGFVSLSIGRCFGFEPEAKRGVAIPCAWRALRRTPRRESRAIAAPSRLSRRHAPPTTHAVRHVHVRVGSRPRRRRSPRSRRNARRGTWDPITCRTRCGCACRRGRWRMDARGGSDARRWRRRRSCWSWR